MADELVMQQHVRWGEEYVSRGLNTKFSGVLEPGVYRGFNVAPGGGMDVLISPDDDFTDSVAVVERDGYNITVRAPGSGRFTIPAAGTHYICIDAYYSPQQAGFQRIVSRATPEAYHVVIAKVVVPVGATEITAAMISEDGRMTGSPIEWLIENAAKLVEVQTANLTLQSRLGNLEQWAVQQGYKPSTVYSPNGNN